MDRRILVVGATGFVGKRLVRVEFLGMPNILAGREIAREFLQDAAQPEAVADEVRRLLREPNAAELAAVIAKLGGGGAAGRAADAICEALR